MRGLFFALSSPLKKNWQKTPVNKGDPLAKKNYNYEKRQKEIARQEKKDQKQKRKLNNDQPTSDQETVVEKDQIF